MLDFRHMLRKHFDGEIFECHCGSVFDRKYNLSAHQKAHNEKLPCNVCLKTFITHSKLRAHWKTNHLKTHGVLQFARSKFQTLNRAYSKMINNFAIKGNENLHYLDTQTCCLCQKKFANRFCLKSHIETLHCKTKMFCDLCPKIISNRRALIHHMQSVHVRKLFACNICDYKTAVKGYFKNHKLIHSAKVECSICNKKVASMKEHMRCHNKPKTTQRKVMRYCDLCPRSFAVRSEILIHIERDHLKLLPFECHICMFKSYREICLDAHLLRHKSGTECKTCGKTVTNMKEHLRTHVKVKCPVCEKLVTKLYLRAHIKSQHK